MHLQPSPPGPATSRTPSPAEGAMFRAARAKVAREAGSIPEAIREEETLRYGAPLLAESIINDSTAPLDHSRTRLSASSDPAVAAFAQLAAFRLGADRALISLFDSKRQHIIAEATRSTPVEIGPGDDRPYGAVEAETLLLAGTAIPRGHGVCEHVLDLPAVHDSGQSLLPLHAVRDLTQDDRFSCKPYFGCASSLRFYAGVPIRSPQGIDIGVCCIFDGEARDGLDASSRRFLRHMSHLVMSHLQSRVSAESYRRHERMVRGLGSMIEGTGSMSKWQDGPNPESFANLVGREGALNEEQQRIQGEPRSPASPDSITRPVANPLQADAAVDNAESEHSTESVDVQSSENETKSRQSFASYAGPHEDDNMVALKALFSRAANIIRESIEIEGALFLDAQIESFGGLVPQNEEEEEGRRQSDGSSDESIATTEDGTTAQNTCRILGFSTSRASSINGDAAAREHAAVPDTFLERVLRRYPGGQVFNFDQDGVSIWAVSDSDEGESASSASPSTQRTRTKINNRPRRSDCAFIKQLFPGARSVALVPLWDSHKERWFAGGFVWTRAAGRVFSVQGELSYLKAFGSATMTEAARIDVLRESKAKEDVLGSLSHEIRSPLHGIILGVELLHDSVLNGFQVDVVHTVENCGRTLLDVLDHLLDFSKVNNFTRAGKRRVRGSSLAPDTRSTIEAGMMSIFSDVNLDMLLEEVVESVYAGFSFQSTSSRWTTRERADGAGPGSYFQQGSTQRRLESVRQMDNGGRAPGVGPGPADDGVVKVYLSVDPNVSWAFYAQPGALRRIFMNIFGNALKYTSKGSILVSLTQEPLSAKKKSHRRTIVFSVSDSGRGISNEYLQTRLFTPFAQENQLSSGAGLGLSIVKQIVHGLGGRISVESRVGHGTTVRISIPLRTSSPRGSPGSVGGASGSTRAHHEFTESLRVFEGVSAALVGFPTDFGADPPLAAETSETRLSPRLFMEVMCQRYLRLRVLSEPEALLQSAPPPSLYICAEGAVDQIPAFVSCGQQQQHSPPPVVVVCNSVLSAHLNATGFASDSLQTVRECIAQPVGPRKLSKVLVLALGKWRDIEGDASHVNHPASPPTDDITPRAPTAENIFSLSVPRALGADVEHHDRYGPSLVLPDRSLAPRRDGTGSAKMDGPTATVSAASPLDELALGPTSAGADDVADFLLVDDNLINLKILSSYMKKLGRTFDTAMNGLEALEACRTRRAPYRCIFMDISMPIMDGLESTRRIRAHERPQSSAPVFIVALTGLASAKTQQDAFASGVDLFLTKPVPLKELGHILKAKAF